MESRPGKYEYLPHTADAKFRAYGKTLEECFSNAAIAMFEILTDTQKIRPTLEFPLEVKAKRAESLLFDFLDELLFLLDTEGFILNSCMRMKIRKVGDEHILTCVAVGDRHAEYEVSGGVKAVTYNDMLLEKLPDGRWMCQVVVDL